MAHEPRRPTVGGQALLDGVLMRSDHAWAIARADGSVRSGPVRQPPLPRIPLVRVYTGLVPALLKGLSELASRGGVRRRTNRRRMLVFVAVLLGVDLVVGMAVDAATGDSSSFLVQSAITIGFFVAMLGGMRLLAPTALWRYHGAEHKAVSAFEAGADPTDVDAALRAPRVHPRCGTNIVFLMLILSLVPVGGPASVQVLVWLTAFAGAVELLRVAGRHPAAWWARLLSGGGRWLQASVTTAEPTAAEQAVGCRALAACLAVHAEFAGLQPAPPLPVGSPPDG